MCRAGGFDVWHAEPQRIALFVRRNCIQFIRGGPRSAVCCLSPRASPVVTHHLCRTVSRCHAGWLAGSRQRRLPPVAARCSARRRASRVPQPGDDIADIWQWLAEPPTPKTPKEKFWHALRALADYIFYFPANHPNIFLFIVFSLHFMMRSYFQV